jgi:hypothetical protein
MEHVPICRPGSRWRSVAGMSAGTEHDLADPHVVVLVGATGDLSRR